VEKYCGARQATDDNMIWCMHFVCWITHAHTLSVCDACCFSIATWFCKHTSVSWYMYIASLVIFACISGIIFEVFIAAEIVSKVVEESEIHILYAVHCFHVF
jgi:hypothetical protein